MRAVEPRTQDGFAMACATNWLKTRLTSGSALALAGVAAWRCRNRQCHPNLGPDYIIDQFFHGGSVRRPSATRPALWSAANDRGGAQQAARTFLRRPGCWAKIPDPRSSHPVHHKRRPPPRLFRALKARRWEANEQISRSLFGGKCRAGLLTSRSAPPLANSGAAVQSRRAGRNRLPSL